MANMSYCKFRNTKLDLADCVNTLEYLRDGDEEPLSPEEMSAAERMYELCQEYIELFDELKEDAE